MAATHRVIVADLKTGQIVLSEDVDLQDLGSNDLDWRRNNPDIKTMPQHEWEARSAASLSGTNVCPWDCDVCNGEFRG